MVPTRRAFISGTTAAATLALGGFAGELRASVNFNEKKKSGKPARILFNENPLGASPKALQVIASSMDQMSRYPLGESPKLVTKLRKLHSLPYSEPSEGLSLKPSPSPEGSHDLVLGVGSSEILKAAAWAYASKGGKVVEAYPSYSAVGSEASRIPGATVSRELVPLDSNMKIDVQGMIQAIDSDTRIVVVCNPNNPTGTTLTLPEIEAIADATPDDALVFVDEAYIEFMPETERHSAVEFAKTRKNVLVTRTFSKIYGMAGLRLGYGLGSVECIDSLKPYLLGGLSMNMPAILGASAAMEDKEHIDATLALNRNVHETWQREFKSFGWKMAPSVTCFCWVDLGEDCSSLVNFLAQKRGVLISGGQRWNLPNCVRISLGTLEENDRLIAGVKAFRNA